MAGGWLSIGTKRPSPRVWTVEADGGAPAKLLLDPGYDGWVPRWSRDGRWIYFASSRSGSAQIWRAPANGEAPLQITRNGGFESRESPDGKYLYFSKRARAKGIWRIALDTPNAIEEKFADFDSAGQSRCWDVGPAGLYIATAGPSREGR